MYIQYMEALHSEMTLTYIFHNTRMTGRCIRTLIDTKVHTLMQAHMHACTHTYTHTHTPAKFWQGKTLAIVNLLTFFPHQNSKMINLPKFHPPKFHSLWYMFYLLPVLSTSTGICTDHTSIGSPLVSCVHTSYVPPAVFIVDNNCQLLTLCQLSTKSFYKYSVHLYYKHVRTKFII